MIARDVVLDDRPRPARSRVARAAAERRRHRTARLRYAACARIVAVVGTLTLAVVVYLALMANVTRMNYELGRAERDASRLTEESARLDDTLERLRSREHLAPIARRLGMHDPSTFASIALPVDRPLQSPPSGLAFLTRL